MNKLVYMLIWRWLIVSVIFFTCTPLLHAQAIADTTVLKGEWLIEKVVTKLFAQQGGQLLETRTYTSRDSMHVNGFVPLDIQFRVGDCIINHQGGTEQGTYVIADNGILEYQPATASQEQPGPIISYTYRLPQPSELVLDMPAAYFKDNKKQLAVKLVYTCYYRKKQ